MTRHSPVLLSLLVFSFARADYLNTESDYVQCKTGRACPNGYVCDEKGMTCCKDGDCSMRSSWALVSSTCKNISAKCPIDYLCLSHNERCIRREVATCDTYIKVALELQCPLNAYPMIRGLFTCAFMYLWSDLTIHDQLPMANCVELHLQSKLSELVDVPNQTCGKVSREMNAFEARAYSLCHFCTAPKSWPYFTWLFNSTSDTMPRGFVQELAEQCANEYANEKTEPIRLDYYIREFVEHFGHLYDGVGYLDDVFMHALELERDQAPHSPFKAGHYVHAPEEMPEARTNIAHLVVCAVIGALVLATAFIASAG